MITYRIEVDKKTCFIFWIQSLIQWRQVFSKNDYQYYYSYFEPWTTEEKLALSKLKRILKKEKDGFLWLINQCLKKSNKKLSNEKEWNEIKKILEKKFLKVWEKEMPLLKKIQIKLEKNLPQIIENHWLNFSKVANFFEVNLDNLKPIVIKLVFHSSKVSAAGQTTKLFPNLIILKTSHLKDDYFNEAINVVLHETVHIIANNSQLLDTLAQNSYLKYRYHIFTKQLCFLFKNCFFKKIKIKNCLKQLKSPSWSYRFSEAIIGSIAAGSSKIKSYFNQNVSEHKITSLVSPTSQIRQVSFLILEETIKYLNNNKKLDKNYCEKLAQKWIKMFSS